MPESEEPEETLPEEPEPEPEYTDPDGAGDEEGPTGHINPNLLELHEAIEASEAGLL